jgi:hypothetical protein
MEIPKAFIYIKNTIAVAPTEEQLLAYYKDYGYETIEDILEEHGNGSWEWVIREWFVNTNFTPEHLKHQQDNNIFRYNNDNDDEEVELIDDEDWEDMKDDGDIY